jgi:hypothetical protein
MILGLVVAVVAVIVAMCLGGSLRRLAETSVKGFVLVAIAMAVQVITVIAVRPEALNEATVSIVFVTVNVLVATFLLLNRAHPGFSLVCAGLFLNALVIGLNGGMPISQTAADIAGFGNDLNNIDIEHELMTASTLAPALGDVIPIPDAQLVVSLGDVLLALGVGRFVFLRTRGIDESNDATPVFRGFVPEGGGGDQ